MANDVPGVLGSRMTGGGFGGCIISLVTVGAVEKLTSILLENYFGTVGKRCISYVVVPSAGAGTC